MKKILGIIFAVFIAIVISVWFILFSQPGNNLIKPIVESKINKSLHSNLKLNTFSLRPSTILLKLTSPDGSSLSASGTHDLLFKKLNIKYNLQIDANERSTTFSNIKLRGPFNIKGTIKGTIAKKLTIGGLSDIAGGTTSYKITLFDKKPKSATIKAKNLNLEKLLYALNKPKYANALINADIDFKNLSKNALKGKALINIANGNMNKEVLKKEFNINAPLVRFNSKAETSLEGNLIKLQAILNSNLGNSDIKGSFNQKNEALNLLYNLRISELSVLKPIIKIALRGNFETLGSIGGKSDKLKIKGIAKAAGGKIDYRFNIQKKKLKSITAKINAVRLEKLLYMLNQPQYATGFVYFTLHLNEANPENLLGDLKVNVDDGLINKRVVKNLYSLDVPKIAFSTVVDSKIAQSIANYTLNIKSSLGSAKINKGIYNLTNQNATGKYNINLPDLGKLYFITKKKLKGSSLITGYFEKKSKNIEVDAFSNMFDGKIEAKLINDKLTGSAKDIEALKIEDMLRYPAIFKSKGKANFLYNLTTKKGFINSDFKNGKILQNNVTYLIKQASGFDITKEIYSLTTTRSTIDNGIITTDLDMQSRLTHISSKKALIDLNKNKIDAKLKIDIKNKPVYVTFKGNLNSPKVGINLKALIEKKIKNKLNKFLKGLNW
ncbi:hypothetical protein [Hippea maritima]|uniref:AsmA family protein n=1 Tax=Hippea maritima (strain ATCC 700847 / DSM 10411 / MH2) TaxID=760142 RepID=F2LUL9_HIPMA|nr:hypothetical protein [Hippea maritima]AEA34609.1 hypothetical protein Hipma_1663 [Hippea maritima DSM 10411]